MNGKLDTANGKEIFRYPWSLKVTFDSILLTLVFFVWVGIILIIRGEGGGPLLIFLSSIIILPLYANGKLFLSDIIITYEHISFRTFNVTWKTVYWSDVIEIRITKLLYPGTNGADTMFIRTTNNNKYFAFHGGPVIISDRIGNYARLIDVVHSVSLKYNIVINK